MRRIRSTSQDETPAKTQSAEGEWLEAELTEISPEMLELAQSAVERELASHEALNARLAGTMAFAGVLLVAALTLGQQAARAHLHGVAQTVFAIGFAGAVVLLASTIGAAIRGIRPGPRHRANPDLLKHYGTQETHASEIRRDSYRREVALVIQLGDDNTRRAVWLLRAQRILAGALGLAAVDALILFFAT